eukprot:Hpha_TRINITY_DN12273_c0_g1::TRINITY_DN12273_c0_g1_i1::g.17100::m.17100/K02730/PSMA6; 20S proteasome subunit alpha 1
MSRQSAYDRFMTVFSPEGRLYQIEYAMNAIGMEKLTNVAVKGADCAVIVAQKKVPDKLLRSAGITHLYNVTEEIGLCTAGRVPDGRYLVEEARAIAGEFGLKFGYEVGISHLARRLSDRAQVNTQHSGSRAMGAALLLVGMDLEDSGELVPKIFKVDPSGACVPWNAATMGEKEREALQTLEKRYKAGMDKDQTLMCAIGALQSTLAANFKAAELEVAIVSKDDPKYRRLSDVEVEDYLTRVAERD